MKTAKLITATAVCLMATFSSIYSQDWPQFRGISRDGKVTGFKAPSTWPTQPKQVWKVQVGTGDATPIVVGKRIYLNTRQDADEVVLCLDASDGKTIWSYKYPVPAATGPAASHPGPRSTPALSGDRIVTFGISGIVTCLDAKDGKVLWKKDNPTSSIPQFYTGMSPLIVDGMCIIQGGSKDNGNVTAYDMKSGNEKWKYQGEGPSYSSPMQMTIGKTKLIVLFTEKSLMALTLADGKVAFQVPAPVQQRFYNCVSPYIDGNRIYYTGQGTGTRALDVIFDNNQFTTKEIWSNPTTGAKWNTPVLKYGFLFGFTDQKKIYCINAQTGETGWIDNTPNSDFATLVDCGQVLIGLPSTGNLVVFKPETGAYSEIARYKVSETPVYSFPVVCGNNIYIKDADSLILYSLE